MSNTNGVADLGIQVGDAVVQDGKPENGTMVVTRINADRSGAICVKGDTVRRVRTDLLRKVGS